jgi:glycerol-3-phosphate acyltransferase PlsY
MVYLYNLFPGMFGLMVKWAEASAENVALSNAIIISAWILCALSAYLLGSLNSAIIVSRYKFNQDIRTFGSGNAGLTNMHRVYGKDGALLTLAGDIGKQVASILVGILLLGQTGAYIAGAFCMLGHIFPVYYRFKGGKGVATTAMVALMIEPWTFLVMLFVFVAITAMTRFVSLASIMCAFLYPILLNAFFPSPIMIDGVLIPTGKGLVMLMGLLTAAFVMFMHRENIKRLYNGKESKINLSRKKTTPPSEGTGGNG